MSTAGEDQVADRKPRLASQSHTRGDHIPGWSQQYEAHERARLAALEVDEDFSDEEVRFTSDGVPDEAQHLKTWELSVFNQANPADLPKLQRRFKEQEKRYRMQLGKASRPQTSHVLLPIGLNGGPAVPDPQASLHRLKTTISRRIDRAAATLYESTGSRPASLADLRHSYSKRGARGTGLERVTLLTTVNPPTTGAASPHAQLNQWETPRMSRRYGPKRRDQTRHLHRAPLMGTAVAGHAPIDVVKDYSAWSRTFSHFNQFGDHIPRIVLYTYPWTVRVVDCRPAAAGRRA